MLLIEETANNVSSNVVPICQTSYYDIDVISCYILKCKIMHTFVVSWFSIKLRDRPFSSFGRSLYL